MKISIRQATAADAALVASISRQTFYDTFSGQNTEANMEKFMNEQFTTEQLMAEVGAANNTFLLAYHNNKIAGYVRLLDGVVPAALNGLPAIEIARLYAVASMKGKGIGSALMQASINHAYSINKKIIWLGVWEKNERAIHFYTKWGFEKFSEHNFILGNDVQRDWLMKKEV